ncbi:hypothetical protein [Noviherbaspirillum sp. Root189]|uniref:hypothetical protein n=1 Tax=Noviherbaspirillum sp. Root189 TaxID=1736487 RepID=UPI0012E3FA3E|nr:hypothetical protein [Noviherbaspirillum sp. Root189]
MPNHKRYKLDELLTKCDPSHPPSAEDQAWSDMAPVGAEYGADDSDSAADAPEKPNT